jgi:glycosyltransferase involved in cell wall biosynthesis
MKILMISPQFRPLVGGYERAAERLSIALAQKGHQVTIIAERQKKEWPKSEKLQNVSILRWWCVYKPGWHIITSILGLAFLLLTKGRKFDVWHIHQYGILAALVAAFGKALHRPVVLKLTSSSYMGIETAIANNRISKVIKRLHLQCNAVVALTRETAKEAKLFGFPQERIHVLGNGVDLHDFRPRSIINQKKKLGLDKRLCFMISVGRLSEEKNIEMLLDAWAMSIPKINLEWMLLIVGFGPLDKYLENYANQLGIINRVMFVGKQTNVNEWLGAADVFIQSSNREGLSNTMLEAMATGLPVIATQVSGTIELVKETGAGIIVPIGDVKSMADAIINMTSSDKLRKENRSFSRKVIEEKYSISKVTFSHEKLYKSLK